MTEIITEDIFFILRVQLSYFMSSLIFLNLNTLISNRIYMDDHFKIKREKGMRDMKS